MHPAAVYEPSGTTTIGIVNKLGIGGSTTVRAIFPTANRFDEYLVKAAVTGPTQGLSAVPPVCAVPGALAPVSTGSWAAVSNIAFSPNVTGSAAIGGNAGAFAAGFSTAPDAFSATFDTLTNAVAGASTVSSCPPGDAGYPCALASGATGPGPYVVYLGYPAPAVRVGNARALEIRGSLGSVAPYGSVATFAGSVCNGQSNAENLQQIVSPAATAAFTHLRASSVKSHKRMTRAYLRSVLAKQHTRPTRASTTSRRSIV